MHTRIYQSVGIPRQVTGTTRNRRYHHGGPAQATPSVEQQVELSSRWGKASFNSLQLHSSLVVNPKMFPSTTSIKVTTSKMANIGFRRARNTRDAANRSYAGTALLAPSGGGGACCVGRSAISSLRAPAFLKQLAPT